jgi:hypothetical protein
MQFGLKPGKIFNDQFSITNVHWKEGPAKEGKTLNIKFQIFNSSFLNDN